MDVIYRKYQLQIISWIVISNKQVIILDVFYSETEGDLGCRLDNNLTSAVCSGRGQCVCSICECDKRAIREEVIFGKFCECDNFSCERHQGSLCGGSERGTCECGICRCLPGWTGSDCTCRVSNAACIHPDGQICSGHGECVCGACKCEDTPENLYSGKYCGKRPHISESMLQDK